MPSHVKSLLFAAAVFGLIGLFPCQAGEAPAHGAISRTPPSRWEDGFFTGNGRMGAMLFGVPTKETFVATHCRLFMPRGNREIVPDLAKDVPEMRRIYHDKGPKEAEEFLVSKAKEQGFPGQTPTDPCHPGFFVNILQPAVGEIRDYERTEDFSTGEVSVRWRDDRGEFRRQMFVSRTDNLIALSLSGPAPCNLEFPALGQKLILSEQETTPEWVTYHNVYAKGKGGYDAAVRIIRKNEGRDVLLLVRIVPWKTPMPPELSEAWAYSPENPDFKCPGVFNPVPALADSSVVAYRAEADAKALMPQLKESLAGVGADYAKLFAPHAQSHSALFNRASLDLGGGADRAKTSEELLDLAQKENRLPAALMEKMYDAGRYMFICSAGELLPNLQGIWTGSWRPMWSGDFTLDTNVQAAMASACSANLPDLMEGYFRTMESFYPEWRINAKRLYGCRGFLTNPRASNTALALHWSNFPGNFWTAGCGWLASFFSQYADYTGDRDFLGKRCLPMLKETAAFYEDFLSETDENGKVVFLPSYNPETGAGINAAMDIGAAREVLSDLIRFSRQLGIEGGNIPKWEALIAKLPPYPVNSGTLSEFPDGETITKLRHLSPPIVTRGKGWGALGSVAPNHRHHSQFYGCYQSFDPLFETDAVLRQAAQETIRVKIAGSDGIGQKSSFGRVQSGVSAAYLGMPEEAYSRLKVMATMRSMTPSLITTHEPTAEIFNTDGNGGIPQIVATMLAFSRPDRVDLLPALPAAWPKGAIRGLRLRNGCTADVAWADGKLSSANFHAGRDTSFTVRYQGKAAKFQMKKGDSLKLNGDLASL